MSTLKIGTYEGRTAFRPGDEVAGKVLWILDKPAKAVELRLFWYTEGKGTRDVEVVDRARFEAPELRGQRDFRFTLPEAPYSFYGRLIWLLWVLELVVLPSEETERLSITVSPTGREILLHPGEEPHDAHEGPV